MSRLVATYLAIEGIAIALYCWLLWGWIGWKAVGPHAFPGSPDASWLYFRSLEYCRWATGFLVGVWVGGVVCVLMLRLSANNDSMRIRNVVSVTLIAGPPVFLIAGHILEGRVT
jgi:hypothetical protein